MRVEIFVVVRMRVFGVGRRGREACTLYRFSSATLVSVPAFFGRGIKWYSTTTVC